MIIYVPNTETRRNTITIPFEPTEDISDRICRLTVEQYYSETTYDCAIECNLTQPHSLAYSYSSTPTSSNNVIAGYSFTSNQVTNNRFKPFSVYVYIPPGPQDLTFTIKRSIQGREDSPTMFFAFLISIYPAAPPRIPATLYVKGTTVPLTITYDPPVHLAGKNCIINFMWRSLFTPVRRMILEIPELTQIHSNDNRKVQLYEINTAWENTPIKFYMPYGPFDMTFKIDTASGDNYFNTYPPFQMVNNNPTFNGFQYTASSSKPADGLKYRAFTTTWYFTLRLYDVTGAYTGTTSTNGIMGEWVQLQIPFEGFNYEATRILKYNINEYVVMGSANGSTFEVAKVGNRYTYMRIVFVSLITSPVRFPSSGMTSNSQTVNDIQYIISKSEGDGNPYLMFDGSHNTGWFGATNSYTSAGNYTGSTNTTVSGVVIPGTWIKIETDSPFYLSSYTIRSDATVKTRAPNTWTLAGSNNGSTWELVDQQTNIPDGSYFVSPTNISKTFQVNNTTTAYQFYRFIFTKTNGGTTLFLKELELNGNAEMAGAGATGIYFTGDYYSQPRFLLSFEEV